MAPWLWLAIGLVITLIASVLHYVHWVRRLSVPMDYALEELLRTEDGACIELRRLEREGEPVALPPVLLVHGVGIDHRNHDMLPQLSLARHLASTGRDVWLLTLRSGIHGQPRGSVRFAKMVEIDLPLAVREVLERTHATQLDYVGFSMGGILLYAALGKTVANALVRRVVILGSPARIAPHFPLSLARWVPLALVPPLPLRLASRMVAFAADWVETPIHRVVYNARNVERGVAPRALIAIADVPAALASDFASWMRGDGAVRYGGEPVAAHLAGTTQPALFFAGAADRLAPEDAVRVAYDAWGATAKRFVLLAEREGACADYGHGDLAIGRGAQHDVFVPVAEFLAG